MPDCGIALHWGDASWPHGLPMPAERGRLRPRQMDARAGLRCGPIALTLAHILSGSPTAWADPGAAAGLAVRFDA